MTGINRETQQMLQAQRQVVPDRAAHHFDVYGDAVVDLPIGLWRIHAWPLPNTALRGTKIAGGHETPSDSWLPGEQVVLTGAVTAVLTEERHEVHISTDGGQVIVAPSGPPTRTTFDRLEEMPVARRPRLIDHERPTARVYAF